MADVAEMLALADRVERGEVKALSIKQPYPHHIFHDGKDVENRDWPTRGRGWVIVHAGKTDEGIPASIGTVPKGGVVGMMKIIDCVQKMDSKWFFGRYGFVIGDKFPIELIPARGQLGFFQLPAEVNAAVAAAIRALANSPAKAVEGSA
jgi:hypothetical protein